jgi:3-oxoacyl-[acyl-carrier-protein] synthase-3
MDRRTEQSMTVLESVATHLPGERVTIDDMAGPLALSPMQVTIFKRYQGLAEVRADPDGSLVDLLAGAAAGLDDLAARAPRIRYVLYARTLPTVVPYPENPLHELCRRFGLDRAVAFTVTHHACASGLLALYLAGRLLEASEPDALALVLAGEKRFTRDAQAVLQAGVIFGEGAAACLVGAAGDRDRMLSYASTVDNRLDLDKPEVAPQMEKEYPARLAEVVTTAVARAGLCLSDISLLLPHNVNVASWQRLCRHLGYPVERVLLDNVPRYGHAFCADAFINYRTACDRGLLRPGTRYLVTAAGFARGATFAAMVFEH